MSSMVWWLKQLQTVLYFCWNLLSYTWRPPCLTRKTLQLTPYLMKNTRHDTKHDCQWWHHDDRQSLSFYVRVTRLLTCVLKSDACTHANLHHVYGSSQLHGLGYRLRHGPVLVQDGTETGWGWWCSSWYTTASWWLLKQDAMSCYVSHAIGWFGLMTDLSKNTFKVRWMSNLWDVVHSGWRWQVQKLLHKEANDGQVFLV